jgi:altronate hydrolase
MKPFIRIHQNDSVIVLFQDAPAGTAFQANGTTIVLSEPVPAGHKVAVKRIAQGEHVIKFGSSIGVAATDIEPGQWVHTHNLKSGLHGLLEYTYEPVETISAVDTAGLPDTFQGYVRANGEVGIRNEIWILNTVGCINKTCELLAKMAQNRYFGRGIDGVYHFSHPYGCSQLGDDLTYTQKLLASLAQHPNAAGVLIVGLGCENNQIHLFRQVIGDYDPQRIKFMAAQEVEDELDKGMELLDELVAYAETMQRQPVPVSRLKVGLKCGGSDGFSGITANPLVGAFSDLLVAQGGTTLLTEVPEMFGAETLLMNRCADELTFRKTVSLINDFKQYFINHGQEVYENPSPGNKAGGISTLEEKSLGCTQKGGSSRVADVLPYGTRATKTGLNLIQAPGNDQVSVTALAAAGAHLVLFTTGRGTPFGGAVPTVKIATNSGLAERKKHWIDVNAGQLMEGVSMDDMKRKLYEYVLQVASGAERTRNEQHGFREIAIFKDGVTL